MSLGKHYVGLDDNEVRVNETKKMLSFLQEQQIDFCITLNANGSEYPCLFTEATDDEISQYINQYQCSRYVFYSDGTTKYTSNIAEIFTDVYDTEHHIIVIRR